MISTQFIIDPAGVLAQPLIKVLRARFGSDRCLHAAAESPYDVADPEDILRIPPAVLADSFDLVHGAFTVPDIRGRFGSLGLDREAIVVLIDEPLQRAARLYGKAFVDPLEPLHSMATRTTFPDFIDAVVPDNTQTRLIMGEPELAGIELRGRNDCVICPLSGATEILRELLGGASGPVSAAAGEITERVLATLDGPALAKFYRRHTVDLMLWMWASAEFGHDGATALLSRWKKGPGE